VIDPRIDSPIEGPEAWRRDTIRPADYHVELSPPCLDELCRAADELRRFPLPTIVLDPADFDLSHCRAAMASVRGILDTGVRFAILDRLPLDALGEEATAVYWLLSSMVARPVAQKLDGTLIYDVLDTGRAALPGSGVRPDQTNIELKFHNDNSYNATPPEYVGLLCLHAAQSGGHSRVASFATIHNELLARHPDAVARLYRPFWFDRQREFFPGEEPVFAAPVFEATPELRARFSAHQINGGYALAKSRGGEPIDNEGAAALAAMLDIFDDESISADFHLEPGQIQFVHNRAIGHARTDFTDDPQHPRHLVRLWLRDWGRRAYAG
jgi:hypothetical protein